MNCIFYSVTTFNITKVCKYVSGREDIELLQYNMYNYLTMLHLPQACRTLIMKNKKHDNRVSEATVKIKSA